MRTITGRGWNAAAIKLTPILVLLGGALLLMLAGALTPPWPRGVYAIVAAVTFALPAHAEEGEGEKPGGGGLKEKIQKKMQEILKTSGRYNPKKFEGQLVGLAEQMVAANPEVAVILLECTELAPHGFAIQDVVHRPVWDFPTMVNWVYSGVVKRPYVGFM